MNGKGWKGGAKGRRVSPKGIEEKVSLWHRAKKTDGPEDQPKTRKRKGAKKAAVKDCARVYVREIKSPPPPLRTTYSIPTRFWYTERHLRQEGEIGGESWASLSHF